MLCFCHGAAAAEADAAAEVRPPALRDAAVARVGGRVPRHARDLRQGQAQEAAHRRGVQAAHGREVGGIGVDDGTESNIDDFLCEFTNRMYVR